MYSTCRNIFITWFTTLLLYIRIIAHILNWLFKITAVLFFYTCFSPSTLDQSAYCREFFGFSFLIRDFHTTLFFLKMRSCSPRSRAHIHPQYPVWQMHSTRRNNWKIQFLRLSIKFSASRDATFALWSNGYRASDTFACGWSTSVTDRQRPLANHWRD